MTKRDPGFPSRVLVLGATSSIAIATMRQLAARNTRFMLVARNSHRLTAVAQDLLTRGAASVDAWAMDLDDTAAHSEMLTIAAERLGKMLGIAVDWQTLEAFLPAGLTDPNRRRSALASTFVAGLQLAKDGQIELRQTERFGPIHLRKRTEQR